MRRLRVALLLCVVACLCAGPNLAAKKDVRFDGSFTAVEGAPFGQTPEFCVERSGSCPTGYTESCVVGAGHSAAIDAYSLFELLCINFGTGDGFGEYEFTTANGDTLYGGFDAGTSGGNIPLFGPDPGQGPIGVWGFNEWWVDGGTGALEGARSGRNPARVLQTVTATVYLGGTIEIEKDVD